jgi:hypothetical protein
MAGAALHSTMCLDGVCVASQCRHGYTLIDGRCLAAEL